MKHPVYAIFWILVSFPARESCTRDRTDWSSEERKICDQQSTIELQNKLIEQKDSDLKSLLTVTNCKWRDLCRNYVVYGVQEEDNEYFQHAEKIILEEIEEDQLVKDCHRLGVRRLYQDRFIKFSQSSTGHGHVAQELRNARKLRTKGGVPIEL